MSTPYKPITHDDLAYEVEARIRARMEEATRQVEPYHGPDARLDLEIERLEAQIAVLARICARLALLSEPIRRAALDAVYEERDTGTPVQLFAIWGDEATESLVSAIDGGKVE